MSTTYSSSLPLQVDETSGDGASYSVAELCALPLEDLRRLARSYGLPAPSEGLGVREVVDLIVRRAGAAKDAMVYCRMVQYLMVRYM